MRIKAKVLVLEPDKEEVLAMGLNLMDDAHGTEIHQMALERTRVRLSDPSWQKMLGEIGA
jgi:hypothetical protein